MIPDDFSDFLELVQEKEMIIFRDAFKDAENQNTMHFNAWLAAFFPMLIAKCIKSGEPLECFDLLVAGIREKLNKVMVDLKDDK